MPARRALGSGCGHVDLKTLDHVHLLHPAMSAGPRQARVAAGLAAVAAPARERLEKVYTLGAACCIRRCLLCVYPRQARVGDGLAAVAELACERPGSLDCLVVDAGAADAGLAMSCPPPAFLGQGFLASAAAALRLGGLLAVNCVARARAPLEAAARALQARPRLTAVESHACLLCRACALALAALLRFLFL